MVARIPPLYPQTGLNHPDVEVTIHKNPMKIHHHVRQRHTARTGLRCAALILACVCLLLLCGCSTDTHLSFLDAQGPVAAVERTHFLIFVGVLLIFVAGPIFLFLPLFAWYYRYGNKKARYTPKWNSSRFLEVMVWAGPVVIVIGLSVLVWRGTHQLDPYKPLPSDQQALRVQVIGYDWKWLFIYPDLGVATVGTMPMPAGRPVALELTSATVMQSFWIPSLGSQIYTMGGMVTQLHLQADEPGRFLGENTMYSGDGFHTQRFTATAMNPERFQQWADTARQSDLALNADSLEAISRRGTLAELADTLEHDQHQHEGLYFRAPESGIFAAVLEATLTDTAIRQTDIRRMQRQDIAAALARTCGPGWGQP